MPMNVTIKVEVTPSLHKRLQREADRTNQSVAEVLVRAALLYLSASRES